MARTRTSPNKYVVHGLYTPSCALEGRLIQARFHQQIERKKLFENNDDNGTDDSFDNDDINTDPRDTYPSKVSAAKRKVVENEIRAAAAKKRKKVQGELRDKMGQLKATIHWLKATIAMREEEVASLKEGASNSKKLIEDMQAELKSTKEELEDKQEDVDNQVLYVDFLQTKIDEITLVAEAACNILDINKIACQGVDRAKIAEIKGRTYASN